MGLGPRSRRTLDYALAAALAAFALTLRELLPIELVVGLYPLPLAAIVVSAWKGGRGPGWLATLISAAWIAHWFTRGNSLSLAQDSVIGLAIFVAVAVLVTEFSMARRRAEQGLRESESRLRQIADTTPGVLWVSTLDPERVLYVNPSYERIWGRPARDLDRATGTWPTDVHPDDDLRVATAFRQWLAGRANERLEIVYRIVRPDGAMRWIHERGVLIRDERGQVYRATGIADDITERKQAEEALQRSEAYLAETQKLSHTGSWAWVPSTGEMNYLSEECPKLLGFQAEGGTVRFDSFFRYIHPDDRVPTQERLARAIEQRADFELDYRIVRPDGERRDIYAVGHPVLSPGGDLLEFVGTVIDVTQRKRAEGERERLRQAQADLERISRVTTMGELMASLAHEIRQPIAAAITNAKTCLRWLNRERPEIEEARAAASRMAEDTTRAADIVSRVRTMFKKGAPQRDPVDLNGIIEDMVLLLRGEASHQSVSIRTQLAADLPKVMADRIQIQQVLMNLMLNGLEAMEGTVAARLLTVTSQKDEQGCVVSVKDTGPGLSTEQAARIFDAFYTTKANGTGMGLSISRSIVESHGGRLWTDSKGPGATFRFILPWGTETVP